MVLHEFPVLSRALEPLERPINNAGQVVGYRQPGAPAEFYHAFLGAGGALHARGTQMRQVFAQLRHRSLREDGCLRRARVPPP